MAQEPLPRSRNIPPAMADATPCDFDEPLACWAADPARVDPDEYPPGEAFFLQMTWAPCEDCGRQVHLPVALFLYRGLVCPECGRTLLAPPEEAEEWLQRILLEEADFFEQASG